jgi:O-antigen/teichoic acid export membrane protein
MNASRFAKALAGQWTATLYAAAISTLLSFALGRVLGPEAFGAYTYVLTLASLFSIVQDGGFAPVIFRETAHPSDHFPPAASLMSLGLGHLLTVSLGGLVLVWFCPFDHKQALFLAVGYYALYGAGNFLSASLKGQGRFQDEAAWRVKTRTLTAMGIGLVLTLPQPSINALFAACLAGQAAAMLLPSARPAWPRPGLNLDKSLYRSCGAFMLISSATTIYFRSDIVILAQLTDQYQVGQYAAAYRLVDAATMICMPLTHIFFRMLRVNLHSQATFKRSLRLMLVSMSALGLAGTGLGLWLGPWIIKLAFGSQYGQAQLLCMWLVPAFIFILPNGVLTQAIMAIGREGFYAWVTVAVAVANIGLNLALVPLLGAKGSALATIASEALLMAGLILGFRRGKRT